MESGCRSGSDTPCTRDACSWDETAQREGGSEVAWPIGYVEGKARGDTSGLIGRVSVPRHSAGGRPWLCRMFLFTEAITLEPENVSLLEVPLRYAPEPDSRRVPVLMMSPGSRTMNWLRYQTR